MARLERLNGPLVLAISSGMFAVGVLLILNRDYSDYAPEMPESSRVELRLDTAEQTAETFLDAWRKREHAVARRLSTGTARREVAARAEEDVALRADEREVKEQVWDVMATTRLAFEVDERQEQEGGVLLLRGRARGEFLGRPYEREVGFSMQQRREDWRVAEMILGEHISEVPEFLEEPPASQ